jgi:hypothetical protein
LCFISKEIRQTSKKQKNEDKNKEIKETEERENQLKIERAKDEKRKKIQEKLEEIKKQQEERAHIQKISNEVLGTLLKSQPKVEQTKDPVAEKKKPHRAVDLITEIPELEKKKKELAEKRKMEVSPMDRKLLSEHAKNFEITIKERTENNKMIMEKRLKDFEYQYKEFKKDFHTKYTDKILEEEKEKKSKNSNNKDTKKDEKKEKAIQYSKKVREMFSVNPNKSILNRSIEEEEENNPKHFRDETEPNKTKRIASMNTSKNTTSKSAFSLHSNKHEGELRATGGKHRVIDAGELKKKPVRKSADNTVGEENEFLEDAEQIKETEYQDGKENLNSNSMSSPVQDSTPKKDKSIPKKKKKEKEIEKEVVESLPNSKKFTNYLDVKKNKIIFKISSI